MEMVVLNVRFLFCWAFHKVYQMGYDPTTGNGVIECRRCGGCLYDHDLFRLVRSLYRRFGSSWKLIRELRNG